ncbi:MAG: NUDIX hydrolase N-terminal domain-containing protein [Actinomycetota bacterium]|nr:NUDIX hydrolase N-terminal domain-containing protein [Actinomycetota bacterium]
MTASEKDLRRWAEALAGVARTGMAFTDNQFERERYEEIMLIAGDIKAVADEGRDGGRDAEGHVVEWMTELKEGVAGYATPKVAVGAAVVNDEGKLLLIQRADSGVWLYPTGWSDIGYSAPEVVVKEVREETGIEVEVVRLIGVLDGLQLGVSRIPLYSLVFLCRAVGGELRPHELECLDAGWFARDELPTDTLGSERWAPEIFAIIDGEQRDVFYDDLRRPVWRGESGGS